MGFDTPNQGDNVLQSSDVDHQQTTNRTHSGDSITPQSVNADDIDTTGQSAVYAFLSANQSLTAGTFKPVTFDTEVHDNLGEFDPSTGSFSPSESGLFSIEGQINLLNVSDNDKIQFGFGTGFDTNEVITKREGATLGDFSTFCTDITADAFPLDSSKTYKFFVVNEDTDCSVQAGQRFSWMSISRSHLTEP